MLWMKVASAMEELKIILSFLQMEPLWSNLVFESANKYSFNPYDAGGKFGQYEIMQIT